jgi:hypothetical protein
MTESSLDGARVSDAAAALASLGASLQQAGWRPFEPPPGTPWRFVARTSKFRMRWMATQLNTFVFGLVVPPGADVAWLDAWLGDAVRVARSAKGGLPAGIQSGTAVMLAAVGTGLSPDLHAWAANVHGRKFAVITYPMLGDTATGALDQPKRPVLGAIYHGYLDDLANRFVAPAVAGRGPAPAE